MNEFNNTDVVRRRFYLSKESLAYIDCLALQHNVTPSILLDTILKQLVEKQKKV